jgi:plasmid stabilization system protein ParE
LEEHAQGSLADGSGTQWEEADEEALVKRFVRTAAQDDIRRQFRYYLVHEEAPEIAWKFLDAAEGAIQFVVRNPQLGSPRFFPNKTPERPPFLADRRLRGHLGLLRAYY